MLRCEIAGKDAEPGYTPRELARVLRVSPDRVRGWIRNGELPAINVASAKCGKPRFVVLPRHLEEFERGRRAAGSRKAPRRKNLATMTDFYPGD